jgi:threonyl-tRNA synthetase
MRTRAFVQDDAHIFCTEEQIEEEVRRFCEMLRAVYADFGFPDFIVGFSTRPSLRAGSDETWDRAEAMLAAAARAAGLSPRLQVGEGTFYGPKLEFILRDRQGREWQCGTIQLDFVLPERLGAAYVDADNKRRQPAMMHQAILGSIERFLAMLLEHHGGDLPLWLAPDQLVVANIGEAQAGYAERVADAFAQADFRVALDIRPERLPRKIVHARESGIPLLVAVGDREAKDETVSLRYRDSRQSVLPLAKAIDTLRPEAFRLP